MTEWLRLTASDGHEFGAFLARPAGAPKGGIVVLQEIFGVNEHIRSVCTKFAAEGYVALAPALFDRFLPNFESGYSPEEVQVALGYMKSLDWEKLVLDSRAAVERLKEEKLPVSIVGFCLGGSLAFDMATHFNDLDCIVSYYGGRIAGFADKKPNCPILLHYGETDASIPLSNVEEVRAKQPQAEIHLYPAGHGFNRGAPGTTDGEQAAIAWKRTIEFLEKARNSN